MPKQKKAAKKTKKVPELSQTHGKDEKSETMKRPRTLDQVWGDTGHWRYNTMDEKEYSLQLKSMDKADLQSHATRVGIIPIEDRSQLTKRLVTEFKKHVSMYNAPEPPQSSNEISERGMKILKEGR